MRKLNMYILINNLIGMIFLGLVLYHACFING